MAKETEHHEDGFLSFLLLFVLALAEIALLTLITIIFQELKPVVSSFGAPDLLISSFNVTKLIVLGFESFFVVASLLLSILLVIQGALKFISELTNANQWQLFVSFVKETIFSLICMLLAVFVAIVAGMIEANYISESIEFSGMHIIYTVTFIVFYILLFAFVVLLLIPMYKSIKQRGVLLRPIFHAVRTGLGRG